MKIAKESWEKFFLSWAALGIYFFVATFFWASGTAPLRTIFYLFLLFPLLMVLPWRKWNYYQYGGQFTVSALLFSGYLMLSCLWGKPTDIGIYFKQWLFLAFWLCGVSWVFYCRDFNIQRFYRVVVLVAAVFGLATTSFFYLYKGHNLLERLQGMGLLENPTIVAAAFGAAALLAYIISLQSPIWRFSQWWFLVAIVCALPVLLSQTRGALLALSLTSVASLLIIRPKYSIWIPQISIVFIVATLLILIVDIESLLAVREGGALSLRDVIWLELFQRVCDNLWFGLGMEIDSRISITNVGVFHHAHNSWIDILYYSGICGLLLALWHLGLLLCRFSTHPDVLPVYMWLIFGCINLFTNGSTLLAAPDAEWLLYWVPAAILAALISSRRYAS